MRSIVLILILLTIPVSAEIIEVCPNPYNYKAEYVKVRCNTTCILSDGEGNITLSKGVHYLTKNATAFFNEFGFNPDLEFKGKFALSNSRDEIFLYEDGKIDSFEYKNPEKGIIYYRENGRWKERFEDWTNFKPIRDYVEGEVIVTPSNFVFTADTIVSYVFTTDKYVRGNYSLYLDANPVGGIPVNEMEIAREHKTCFLDSNSYRFFHWKFGLNGDEIVITTENWRWDNIGFIVHFKSESISKYLRKILEHDKIYCTKHGKMSELKAFGSLGGVGRSYKFEGNITVFVIPDYNPIYDLMRSAKHEIYIMAPYIRFKDTEFLEILRNKSCKIKVITSDENCAKFLEYFGEKNGLNLEVEVDERVHGKLIIVDDRAVITSANLDKYGMSRNREIGVILEGEIVNSLKDLFNQREDVLFLPSIILLSIAVLVVYFFFRRLQAS